MGRIRYSVIFENAWKDDAALKVPVATYPVRRTNQELDHPLGCRLRAQGYVLGRYMKDEWSNPCIGVTFDVVLIVVLKPELFPNNRVSLSGN